MVSRMTYVLLNVKRYYINIPFCVFWMIIVLYPIATITGILLINKERLSLDRCPHLSVYKAWPIYCLETSGTYLFNMIVSIWYSTVAIRYRLISIERCHYPGKQKTRRLIGWMKNNNRVWFVNLESLKLFMCSTIHWKCVFSCTTIFLVYILIHCFWSFLVSNRFWVHICVRLKKYNQLLQKLIKYSYAHWYGDTI